MSHEAHESGGLGDELSLPFQGLDLLEARLGYVFTQRHVLERALTHPSYANERRSKRKHNQRLEFLGDSVLGMIIATRLYRQEEFEDEGMLTRNLSSLVCEEALANKARELDLGEFLKLGKGEIGQGGRDRDSILCDAYEALLAAIFLDGGYEEVRRVVLALHEREFAVMSRPKKQPPNYKGTLQREVQAAHNIQPHYEIVGTHGPEHDKIFVAQASVNGEVVGKGEGRSKKQAEQEAARDACERLNY